MALNVLSEFVDCLYKSTDHYAPEWESVLAWDDRQIGVEWPLSGIKPPLLSERDTRGVGLSDAALRVRVLITDAGWKVGIRADTVFVYRLRC